MIYRPLCLLLRNKTSRWLLFLVNCYYTVHHAALSRVFYRYILQCCLSSSFQGLACDWDIGWIMCELGSRFIEHVDTLYFGPLLRRERARSRMKSTAGNFFLAIKMNTRTSLTHTYCKYFFSFFFFWKLQFISIPES